MKAVAVGVSMLKASIAFDEWWQTDCQTRSHLLYTVAELIHEKTFQINYFSNL
jgi:P2-related tail formation protein